MLYHYNGWNRTQPTIKNIRCYTPKGTSHIFPISIFSANRYSLLKFNTCYFPSSLYFLLIQLGFLYYIHYSQKNQLLFWKKFIFYSFLEIKLAKSTTLHEYPHSLSYHETILAIFPTTIVDNPSMIDDLESFL